MGMSVANSIALFDRQLRLNIIRLFPVRVELAALAMMSVSCAAVVAIVPSHDWAMMFAAMPLFAIAIAMGGRWGVQVRSRAR